MTTKATAQMGGLTRYSKPRKYSEERNRKISAANTHHGMIHSREYASWENMKYRCRAGPNHKSYKYYRAKGITVCKRWEKFEHFYADMGNRPPNTTLDRINGELGYSPSNCRWADRKTQNGNRKDRHHQ